jgi:hypothetical protein
MKDSQGPCRSSLTPWIRGWLSYILTAATLFAAPCHSTTSGAPHPSDPYFAIAHRLYREETTRQAYVLRLREILDTVWNEEELIALTDQMAAIVQTHALAKTRQAADKDAERVRRFIRRRRVEILADLDPQPPAWPWPLAAADFCWGDKPSANASDKGQDEVRADIGLIINEVAARGEPLDWFELYNASETPLELAGFVLADDLTDGR